MTTFAQVGIQDTQTGRQLWVDEFNAIRANPTHRLVGKTFINSTKDPNFWVESVTNGGTITQSNGLISLRTNSAANATTQYQTRQIAHFIPGQENSFRSVLRLGDLGIINNIRNWGAFNSADGFFFQLNGTALNIVHRRAGVDTIVPQASWNGNGAGLTNAFVLNTNFHVWEIKYTYIFINFYIDHYIMHTLGAINSPTLFSSSLDFPATVQNNNIGGQTANVSMEAGVVFISRIGNLVTRTHYTHVAGIATNTLKYGAGRLENIIINAAANGTVITIYDNVAASGNVVGIISGNTVGTFVYDVQFNTGLTVVTANANTDITVSYE